MQKIEGNITFHTAASTAFPQPQPGQADSPGPMLKTMPRTCFACTSPERDAIEKALVSGEPLRNIAKRVSISPAALLRHKEHVAQAIVAASEKREEQLGIVHGVTTAL
jgi:hypothetical protein